MPQIIRGGLKGPTEKQALQTNMAQFGKSMQSLAGLGAAIQGKKEAKQEASLPAWEETLAQYGGDEGLVAQEKPEAFYKYYNTLYGPNQTARMLGKAANQPLSVEGERVATNLAILRGNQSLASDELRPLIESARLSGNMEELTDYAKAQETLMGEALGIDAQTDVSGFKNDMLLANQLAGSYDPASASYLGPGMAQPTSPAILREMERRNWSAWGVDKISPQEQATILGNQYNAMPIQAAGRSSVPGMGSYDQATNGQDAHHTAVLGEGEGVLNMVAMQQPGVAELVEQLNAQFPNPAAQLAPDSLPTQIGQGVQSGGPQIMAGGQEQMPSDSAGGRLASSLALTSLPVEERVRLKMQYGADLSPEDLVKAFMLEQQGSQPTQAPTQAPLSGSKQGDSMGPSAPDPVKEEEKRIGSIIKFQDMAQKTQDPQVQQMIMQNLTQLGWQPPPPRQPQPAPIPQNYAPYPHGVGSPYPVAPNQLTPGITTPPIMAGGRIPVMADGNFDLSRFQASQTAPNSPVPVSPLAVDSQNRTSPMGPIQVDEFGNPVLTPNFRNEPEPAGEPYGPATEAAQRYLNPGMDSDIFEISTDEFRANPEKYEPVVSASKGGGIGLTPGMVPVRLKEGTTTKDYGYSQQAQLDDKGLPTEVTKTEEEEEKPFSEDTSTNQERGQNAVSAAKSTRWLNTNKRSFGSAGRGQISENFANLFYPEGVTIEDFASTTDRTIAARQERDKITEAKRQWDEKMVLEWEKHELDEDTQKAIAEAKTAALTWSKKYPEAWEMAKANDKRQWDLYTDAVTQAGGDTVKALEIMAERLGEDPALMNMFNSTNYTMALATGDPTATVWTTAEGKDAGWAVRAWYNMRNALNTDFDVESKIAEYKASRPGDVVRTTVDISSLLGGGQSEEDYQSFSSQF